MRINAIVATDENHAIGKDNQIPWYLPADLKYFKKTTLNHHILMGRKSFLSIGRPLPRRVNMVLTRDPFFTANGVVVVHSVDEALDIAKKAGEEEFFVIGGGEIYRQCLSITDRVFRTLVHTEVEGDTFFPELPPEEWKLISEEKHQPDDRNKFHYSFQIYERKR